MATYKTPGVYVEEISTLPPSVAAVSTAIPAFIGHTERGPSTPARITTMLEFETIFGMAHPSTFAVAEDESGNLTMTRDAVENNVDYLLYYSVSLYFKNGGGSCYIISVGDYTASISKDSILNGLALLEMEDEPTLIVIPEAVHLGSDFFEVAQASLAQCKKLQDRFAILDVPDGNVQAFRDNTGTDGLMYGAAYYPYLNTTLNYQYAEDGVVMGEEDQAQTMAGMQAEQTGLYNQIKAAMNGQRVTLPPSAAIAGVYARVDRDRGVWKAPANVSLSAVLSPVTKITHEAQEGLNIDPTAGKSINAIRAFTGKGTLVWGARTLAGNDNEWRYVSVRRLFNMIEESAKKATAFAVFEPNDATTWLKVKAMIESFLYGLWEQGALAGPTPDAAYFVNVGLGKTMTAQDVLEGRMNVEIGIAAVRPAEFIILKFSHKLQEA